LVGGLFGCGGVEGRVGAVEDEGVDLIAKFAGEG